MPKVIIEYEVNASGAIQEIRRVNQETGQTATAAQTSASSLNRLKSAVMAVGAAFAAAKIASFMRDAVRAAAEQEAIFRSLAQSMTNVGVSYNAVAGDLQTMFAKLQATTVYGDTDSARVLQRLISTTQDYGASVKLLVGTLDLASAKQLEAATAADLVGRAVAGNFGSLSRYGIVLDEATQKQLRLADTGERAAMIAKMLADRFGGAAAAEMDTFSGRIKALGNAWGDLTETVGALITTLSGLPGASNKAIDVIKGLNEGLIRLSRALVEGVVIWSSFDEIVSAEVSRAAAHVWQFVHDFLRAWSMLPEWLGGGKKAQQAALDAMKKSLEAIIKAGQGYAQVFLEAKKQGEEFEQTLRGLKVSGGDAMNALAESTGEAAESTGDLGEQLDALLASAQSTIDHITELGRDLEESIIEKGGAANETLDEMVSQLEAFGPSAEEIARLTVEFNGLAGEIAAVSQAAMQAYSDLQRGFGDVIYLSITGRFQDIEDAWRSLWEGLASDLADALSQVLMQSLVGSREEFLGLFVDYARDETGQIIRDAQGNPIPTGLTGLGRFAVGAGGAMGAYGGFQSGGLVGGLTTGLGVAGLLQSLGLFTTASGALGPVGIALAGVAALVSTIFGGQDKPPTPTLGWSWTPGQGASAWGQDLPSGATSAEFAKKVNEVIRTVYGGFLDSLEAFGWADLFDQVHLGSLFGPEMHTRDLNSVIQETLNSWIPGQIQNQLAGAFYEGFYRLGASQEWVDRLFGQMNQLGADERLRFLNTVVNALVSINDAVDSLDWSRIEELATQSPLEAITANVDDILEQIDVIQARMGAEIDLGAAAEDAQRIADAIQQAGTSIVQMLTQIRQVADQLHRSIQSQIEGIQLGMMSPAEQQSYLVGRIQDLMGQLGDASSVAEVQWLQQQIQQYVQMLQQLLGQQGVSLQDYMDAGFGNAQTWGDYLIDILTQTDELAQGALGQMEDALHGLADQLQDAGEVTRGILLSFGEETQTAAQAVATMGQAAVAAAEALSRIVVAGQTAAGTAIAGAEASPSVYVDLPEPRVIISIDGNLRPLIGLIDARIEERMNPALTDWS